jgi:hypothetical protein
VWTRLPAAAAAAAIALTLSGCGGSEGASEKWANDVCGTVVDWRDHVQDQVDQFRQDPNLANVSATIQDVVQSTTNMVSDLKGIGAPDTPSGDAAKKQVDAFADSISSRATNVQSAVSSGGLGAADEVSTEISGAIEDGQRALAGVENLTADLRQGIEDAKSCKDLRG